MTLKPIKTVRDHKAAMKQIDALWDSKPGSPASDELEVLVILVEAYEKKKYPFPAPDPIEAIKFRMEQQGLTTQDLATLLGGRNRASEVLNRKRGLSLAMIKSLYKKWHIPAEALLAG
jgi:HTH-type transcriptional regulator/antitoxin HigA